MSRTHSLARPILAIAVATSAVAASAPGALAQIAAPPEPSLRLVTSSKSVELTRYVDEDGNSWFEDRSIGIHFVAAKKTPFDVRVTRKSYKDPIVAKQLVRKGNTNVWKTLPAGLVKNWYGFDDFTRLTLTDAAGKTVLDGKHPFCANSGASVRYTPDAPATSPYPYGCPWNPFTLGSVWGLQRGWAAEAIDPYGMFDPGELADGTYTAKVSVEKKYRDLLRVAATEGQVKLTIKTVKLEDPHAFARAKNKPRGVTPKPAAKEPTGPGAVPKNGPKPDLRALPAWSIWAEGDLPETPEVEKDTLSFAANVWNAGPSPLVVDGFRRANEDLMDAYQYFYDLEGNEVGYKKTGTMEWDDKEGHHHWHFKDFAGYSLLKADQEVVRSQKEAFCLAPTDAIDLFVKGATWKPGHTDLHTACGTKSSLSLREVLEAGHGDTYYQSVAGQSFDIHNLPNGTYYIKVEANPTRNLYESNLKNNVSLRKVILGGKPGARTVQVPPYDGIDTEGPIG
jgi:hypothetical protein